MSGKTHRPMFPQYQGVWKTDRTLFLLEKGRVYDEQGNGQDMPVNELGNFLEQNNAQLIIRDFASEEFEPYTKWLIANGKVMCDRRGHPSMARFKKFWIVEAGTWNYSDLSIETLSSLRALYKYIDLGVAPTPGSLGKRTMLAVWADNKLPWHTALSLKAEEFLYQHAPSSVVQNNGYVGRDIPLASLMDAHFAFIGEYNVLPWGTPEFFGSGDPLYYPLYFAHCKVRIRYELPLGLFAISGEHHRLVWPTLPGTYETYLWSDQIDDLRQAMCDVRVLDGYGWQKIDNSNQKWSEWIYNKRHAAPSEELAKRTKGIGVAAIGHQGMGREHHVLRTGETYDPHTDWPVVHHHIPLHGMWVHPVVDWSDAPMLHWQRRVVAKVNRKVLAFAWPYAERRELVAIDHDGVMLLAGGDDRNFIQKKSFESIAAPAGSWLWSLQHNVHYYALRIWTSDEEPERYGKLLLHYVRDGVLV